MGLISLTAPVVEPVTLGEAKAQLNVIDDTDDSYISGLISVARKRLEDRTGRAWISQQWRMTLDGFPRTRALELPRPSLMSVEAIRYFDADGNVQVFPASSYIVDTSKTPGIVELANGEVWPVTQARSSAAEVDFTAGYGVAGADIPETLRHAVKIYLSDLYAHRESIVTGTIVTPIPGTVNALIASEAVF